MNYCSFDTILGPMMLATSKGQLRGAYFLDQKYLPKPELIASWTECDTPLLRETRQQIHDYYAGQRCDFTIPISPQGTDFQRAVWQLLREIPYGETTSYGALAKKIKSIKAAHALGAAVGRNPITVIIPCHRAVGANGSLTGYVGGLQRKQWLLDLESGQGRMNF